MSYILASEPPLDPPEPEIAYCCDVCGDYIYVGESYYDMEGTKVCSECIMDYIDRNYSEIAEKPEPDYEED